ncbi:MAG: hypothetical protein SOR56_07930, partial [Oscillospiraceae bacterium]|nr:hypothetical protein [Oscillospiraceae bacterium]
LCILIDCASGGGCREAIRIQISACRYSASTTVETGYLRYAPLSPVGHRQKRLFEAWQRQRKSASAKTSIAIITGRADAESII